jgi:peptidoglycan/LPS O-acetylase OafA/YrhL
MLEYGQFTPFDNEHECHTIPLSAENAKAAGRKQARYVPEFDGLRGLSILLVIIYHCWKYSGTAVFGQVVGIIAGVG